MDLGERGYDIRVERGALGRAQSLLNLNRRVLIVTDDGVPSHYAATVAAQCKDPLTVVLPQGEATKSLASLELLLKKMLEAGFTRSDCVVAVGGGVIGDLAGFAASCYMRGIDFYNIPTTLLSQVDSSIGGKVAVNLSGVKNCVGAFYQPRAVLIDPDTLETLPARQIAGGMAEALKMAMTSDAALFEMFERGEAFDRIEDVIVSSLRIKKSVVEQDEREGGLRRILNFGHTLGHGVESSQALHGLYHGECVALGMIPMCDASVRARLLPILKRLGLPTALPTDAETVLGFVSHDKKCAGDKISVIYVPEIGKFEIQTTDVSAFCDRVRPILVSMA
jgi:3-dehydroquinate synthase